jgi:hypothetical protein
MSLENRVSKLEQQTGISRASGVACNCPVGSYDVRVILPNADGSPHALKSEPAKLCAVCGLPQDVACVVVLPGGETIRQTQGAMVPPLSS